jgi:uncharacterized phage protein (TIGR02218 family)
MKTADSALVAFLNSARQAVQFDLWTIRLANDITLLWTDADIDLTVTGRSFVRGPAIPRDRVKWVRGIEVDQLKARFDGPGVIIGGVALPAFAAAGGFDGATAVLERVYLNDSGVVQGALVWFPGVVAQVAPSRMGAELTIKSQLVQLNQQLPRNLYQSGCLNDLFDSQCAVSRAAHTHTGTVTAVSSSGVPGFTGTVSGGFADGFFSLGVCSMTSGANAGLARTVRASAGGGALTFTRPWPFPVAVGDTYSLTPGCDKLAATCAAKFANLPRFRGLPYIPVPETVT